MDREEDAAPVDMLASLFEARGWDYDFVGDDEITSEVQGSWASYQVRGIWRREDHVLQLLCLPDIRVPDEKRAPMFEVLALVNEQMWLGHFDVWSNGMVLLYRRGRDRGVRPVLSGVPVHPVGRQVADRSAGQRDGRCGGRSLRVRL